MFSYSGLSFNAAASTSLGLMPSYEKSPPEDNDFDELWQTLSSSVWWPNVDMEGEAASKEELEEVKTVFVSGLPMDVRPREIYLLFRPFKGYVASCLKLVAKPGKMAQPVAFVTFETRKEAQAAIDELQGIHFDPSHAQTLRLELAKSNSRKGSKKSSHHHHHHHHHPHPHSHQHQHPAPPAAGGKPANQGSPYVPYPPGQAAPVVSGFGFLNLANNPWAPPQPSAPVPVPVPPYVDMASFGAIQEGPIHPTAGLPTPPPHPQENDSHVTTEDGVHGNSPLQPCSTLFVANLEPHQNQDELSYLFSSCDGFMKAKMYIKGGPPVCFVHFKDIQSATQSRRSLQGYVLPSSRRGLGIRIEFARQTMGTQQQQQLSRSLSGSIGSASTPHSDSSSTYSC